MNGIALLLVAASLGQQYGYQIAPNGEAEYLLQIHPSQIDQLKTKGISSVIPPELEGVRHIRIVVGTGKLPRDPKALAEVKKRGANAESAKAIVDAAAEAAKKLSQQGIDSARRTVDGFQPRNNGQATGGGTPGANAQSNGQLNLAPPPTTLQLNSGNTGVTQPGVTQPGVTQPGVTQPGVTQPGVTQPGVTQPDVTQPGVTQPDVTQPGVTQPGVTQPDVTQPDVTQPDVTQPDVTQPGSVTIGGAAPSAARGGSQTPAKGGYSLSGGSNSNVTPNSLRVGDNSGAGGYRIPSTPSKSSAGATGDFRLPNNQGPNDTAQKSSGSTFQLPNRSGATGGTPATSGLRIGDADRAKTVPPPLSSNNPALTPPANNGARPNLNGSTLPPLPRHSADGQPSPIRDSNRATNQPGRKPWELPTTTPSQNPPTASTQMSPVGQPRPLSIPGESTKIVDSSVRPAGGVASDVDGEAAGQRPEIKTLSKPNLEERPWGTLVLALFALCASGVGNVYLGWSFWGLHQRYRKLLQRVHSPEPMAA